MATKYTKKILRWLAFITIVIAAIIILSLWGTGGLEKKPKPLDGAYALYPDGTYKKLSIKKSGVSFQTIKTPKTAQELVDAVFGQQRYAEFKPERIAFLLLPGTHKLNITLGYYTSVYGIGETPDKVNVEGTITSLNNDNPCIGALDNFFRSISNLTINVPDDNGTNYFRTSQASPLRDLVVKGNLGVAEAQKGCGGVESLGGYSSGGYMHNVRVTGEFKLETQQQFLSQNCKIEGKVPRGGAWNILFVGCESTVTETDCFTGQQQILITVKTTTPGKSASAPRLMYDEGSKKFMVLRPSLKDDARGLMGYEDDQKEDVVLVDPTASIEEINKILADGKNLALLPGQYRYSEAIQISKPETILLGLGYAALNPTNGNTSLVVNDAAYGVRVCGLMIEAGQKKSDVLVKVGENVGGQGQVENPTILYDIFPRVGGPTDTAAADIMMEINQSHCLIMHTWLWRSDHTATERAGLGTDKAVCKNALVVNGDSVRIFGLFAEHTLEEGIVWNGGGGRISFLQSEMAYDVVQPWNYPMLHVKGEGFEGDSLGVYSYFARKHHVGGATAPNVTTAIKTEKSDATIHTACTVFLNASEDPVTGGAGSIESVWNEKGKKSDRNNADIAMWIKGGNPCPAPPPPPQP